jgi:hypothetical protein
MVTYSITEPTTWGLSNSPFRFIYNLISASASVTDLRFLGKINYIQDITGNGLTVSVTQSVAAELSLPLRPDGKSVLDAQLMKSKFTQVVNPPATFLPRLTNYVRFNLSSGFECNPNGTFSNVSNIGGKLGLITGSTAGFRVDDYIAIQLDNKFTNPQYDGYTFISSFTGSTIVTTTDWGLTSSTTQSGDIYYLNRYDRTSSDDYLVEGAVQYDNRGFDLSSLYVWRSSGWSTKRFLTGYPNGDSMNSNTKKNFIDVDLNTGDYETIFLLTDRLGDFKNIVVNTYNSNGVNMGTYSATVWGSGTIPTDTLLEVPSGATSSTNSWKMFEVGIGAQQAYGIGVINDFDPPSLSEFFNGVKYYSFRFTNQSNVFSQPIYRMVACNPSVYVNKRIIFKNRLGGYDYVNFDQKNSKSIEINKNNYKKPLDPTINIYSGSDLRQATTINVKYDETYRVSTHWMTEDEYNYLNELLTSEDVYVYEDTELKPIQIVETNFEFKTFQNQDIFILNLTYKYAFDRLA